MQLLRNCNTSTAVRLSSDWALCLQNDRFPLSVIHTWAYTADHITNRGIYSQRLPTALAFMVKTSTAGGLSVSRHIHSQRRQWMVSFLFSHFTAGWNIGHLNVRTWRLPTKRTWLAQRTESQMVMLRNRAQINRRPQRHKSICGSIVR